MNNLREVWKEQIEEDGFKYFVLKTEDVFKYLTEEEVKYFDSILKKIEVGRLNDLKKASNNYYIVNRDETYAEEVKQIIEQQEGIKIK